MMLSFQHQMQLSNEFYQFRKLIGFSFFSQCEAIPEGLKNMLLVMDTAGIFQTENGTESQLWRLTWDKIDTFLPNLRQELFKPYEQPGQFLSSLQI